VDVTSLRLRPGLALAAVLLSTLGAGSAQAGVTGLTVLTSGGHVANGLAQTRASVECPKGKVPLGGGAFLNGSDLAIGIASSFPVDRFWIVDVSNPTAAATTFTIRVVCARKPKQYSLSAGLFTPLPAGAALSAFAGCPTGSQPLGGGADTSASIPLVNMTASQPTGQAWQATESNGTAVDAAVASFTTCGSLKGYTVVDGGALSIGHGETRLTAGCPRNTIAIGGGASGTPATAITINSSAPNNAFSDPSRPFDLWDTEINNVSNAPATARAWAVCVRP
jgi:hypothetical protein